MKISDLKHGDTVRVSDFDVEGASHDIELTYDGPSQLLSGVRDNGTKVVYSYEPDTEIVHGYIDWMSNITIPTLGPPSENPDHAPVVNTDDVIDD